MPIIGIYADYLLPAHRAQIESTVRAHTNEYQIRYFSTAQEMENGISDCEILYGYYPAAVLKRAECLRWFATASAGVDPFLEDAVYAHPDQVLLTNSAGSYGTTISEHMLMVMLMLLRRMPEYTALTQNREWRNIGAVRSIWGSRITIIGMGDIGTNLARRVKALGAAHVCGVRRTKKPSDPAYDQVLTLAELPEAVKDADIVALCLPATKETNGVFSKEIIDGLSPKTFVVNVGRGSAIDQPALVAALNEGRIAGAALDVMTPEPLPIDDPLYDAANVILTPHISGNMSLGHTCDLNVDMFCRNLKRYFTGEPLHHLVDRSVGY